MVARASAALLCAAVAAFLCVLPAAYGFYLPGVAPQDFKKVSWG